MQNKKKENLDLISHEDLHKIIINDYKKTIKEKIIIYHKKIHDLQELLESKCNCSTCAKYVYNKEKYELNKKPETDCLFLNCSIQDLIDFINDIIKNYEQSNSIFDLSSKIEKMDLALISSEKSILNAINNIKTHDIKFPILKYSIIVIIIAIIIILIVILIIFLPKILKNLI